MALTLYDEVLQDKSFAKASQSADRAIEKQIDSQQANPFPKNTSDLLSVSFPAEIGFATYDIERSIDRQTVGKAFGVEQTRGNNRRARVTIALFDSPVIAIAEGLFSPKQFEVWFENKLIGTVTPNSSGRTYKLSSERGGAKINWEDDHLVFRNGKHSRRFGLQLDLSSLRKKSLANSHVVYDPTMDFCNPIMAMAFTLMIRMVYRRADFRSILWR